MSGYIVELMNLEKIRTPTIWNRASAAINVVCKHFSLMHLQKHRSIVCAYKLVDHVCCSEPRCIAFQHVSMSHNTFILWQERVSTRQ